MKWYKVGASLFARCPPSTKAVRGLSACLNRQTIHHPNIPSLIEPANLGRIFFGSPLLPTSQMASTPADQAFDDSWCERSEREMKETKLTATTCSFNGILPNRESELSTAASTAESTGNDSSGGSRARDQGAMVPFIPDFGSLQNTSDTQNTFTGTGDGLTTDSVAGRGDDDDFETTDEFKLRLMYWIEQMMFVSGETAEPSVETTWMIEEIVREQVLEMVGYSSSSTHYSLSNMIFSSPKRPH